MTEKSSEIRYCTILLIGYKFGVNTFLLVFSLPGTVSLAEEK